MLDDTLGVPLHHSLPNFTVRLGFLLLLSESLSAKTSGDERHGLTGFGCDASERSLEKVAKTLETLNLQGCKLKDSQLNALLPSFIRCSQLTKVNFYNNDFSMPILKDLLQQTANWNKMNVEQYPAPLECYNELGHVSVERFAQLCQELMDTLRAIRQPKSLSFATRICHKCGEPCVYGQGGRLCFCWR